MDEHDSEVLFECWAYKGTVKQQKTWKIKLTSWKRMYFRLQRYGQCSSLCYFKTKPRVQNASYKGCYPLKNFFELYRYTDRYGKPYCCHLSTDNEHILIGFTDQRLHRMMAFFLQTQMKIRAHLEEQCFVVRPDNSLEHHTLGSRKRHCLLHISAAGIILALELEKCVLAYWPLQCIRSYEVNNERGLFQFDVGELAPTGAGRYVVVPRGAEGNSMYERLDSAILELAGLKEMLSHKMDVRKLSEGLNAAILDERELLSNLITVETDGAVAQKLKKISRDIYDEVQELLGTGPLHTQSVTNIGENHMTETPLRPIPVSQSTGRIRQGTTAKSSWTFEPTGLNPQPPPTQGLKPISQNKYQNTAEERTVVEQLGSSYLHMASRQPSATTPVMMGSFDELSFVGRDVSGHLGKFVPSQGSVTKGMDTVPWGDETDTGYSVPSLESSVDNTQPYYGNANPHSFKEFQRVLASPHEVDIRKAIGTTETSQNAIEMAMLPTYGDSYSLHNSKKKGVAKYNASNNNVEITPLDLQSDRYAVSNPYEDVNMCHPPRAHRMKTYWSQSSQDLTGYEQASIDTLTQSDAMGSPLVTQVGDYCYVPPSFSLSVLRKFQRQNRISGSTCYENLDVDGLPIEGGLSPELADEVGLSKANPSIIRQPRKDDPCHGVSKDFSELYAKVIPKSKRRSRSYPETFPEMATNWRPGTDPSSPRSPDYCMINDVHKFLDTNQKGATPVVIQASGSVKDGNIGFYLPMESTPKRPQAPQHTNEGATHPVVQPKPPALQPATGGSQLGRATSSSSSHSSIASQKSPRSISPIGDRFKLSLFNRQGSKENGGTNSAARQDSTTSAVTIANSNGKHVPRQLSTASSVSVSPVKSIGISATSRSRKFVRQPTVTFEQSIPPSEVNDRTTSSLEDGGLSRVRIQGSMQGRRLPSIPHPVDGDGEGEYDHMVYDEIQPTVKDSKC